MRVEAEILRYTFVFTVSLTLYLGSILTWLHVTRDRVVGTSQTLPSKPSYNYLAIVTHSHSSSYASCIYSSSHSIV